MATLRSSRNPIPSRSLAPRARRTAALPLVHCAPLRRLLVAGLLASVALLTACRTAPPPVDLAAPGWRVWSGQAIWKPSASESEIAGELLLALNADGQGLIQFSKAPFTLVEARFAPGQWRIELPLRRIRACGHGDPPARFAWFQLPAIVLIQPPGAEWCVIRGDGGTWRVVNQHTGETLNGFWSP
jgi:hypothetical protein